MEKRFFKIVIPVFDCMEYVEKCIMSVENQTFKDFYIVAVNDKCTDKTFEIVKKLGEKYDNIITLEPLYKVWNGGARNIGSDYPCGCEYTLFLDNDDWFCDNECLENIYNTIMENDMPDLVRLSYYFSMNGEKTLVRLNESTPTDLVNSVYIAPWTKCVKSNLVTRFPENTLIEDVVQHISQCDCIKSIAVCDTPVVVWNRDNKNSISLKENQHLYNNKRISSVYRNVADLMDLKCVHNYCINHKNWRIEYYKNMIKSGKEGTF